MKAGDKLYCFKSKSKFFPIIRKKFTEFTHGKTYEISSVMLGNPTGGSPFESLVFYDDKGDMRYLNYNSLGNLSEVLYTEKEFRKMKLKNISKITNK